MLKKVFVTLLGGAMFVMAAPAVEPENPATGIWIQQVGEIEPHPSTKATLYYTKYSNNDRVKSVDYYYDGAGYLNVTNKRTLCTSDDGMSGADGIVHHSDGDLIVAGQGRQVHKISKTAGAGSKKCVVASSTMTDGVWHLMNDPKGKYVWAAGIPGKLHRILITDDPVHSNFDPNGYNVTLTPDKSEGARGQHSTMATLIWDEQGNAFYTRSDYYGGGCERTQNSSQTGVGYDFRLCNDKERAEEAAKAYFGYITDTVYAYVANRDDSIKYHAPIGDSAITELKTKILIDSLEGAHGGTYDTFSKTIFVFGGAKIVQILPYMEGDSLRAKVVASIDLRDYFFDESYSSLTEPRTNDHVGWRLDQGTVDGLGHLFVASNTGHLVFVDYAANPRRYIDNNVLVHLQWIDNFLDDLAPLSGPGVLRHGAVGGNESELSSNSIGFSSSRIVYVESSSSKAKSSSSVKSSSSGKPSSSAMSSGKTNSSSSKVNSSDSGTPGSGVSSSGANPNSSTGSTPPGSSGSNVSSSGSNPNTSTGTTPPGSSGSNVSSSGSNPGSSTGNVPGSGTSTGKSSGSTAKSSSGMHGSGIDLDDMSSSSRRYVGFDDYDLSSSGGIDFYPSADKFEKGDSLVAESVVLVPVDSANGAKGTVTIGENVYLVDNNPSSIKLDLHQNSGMDSALVGQVVALTLDSAKVVEYFGDVDSLILATGYNIDLIDPKNPVPSDTIKVNADGSVTIWVTAQEAVRGASIIVADPKGNVVVIDNINFFDFIPDAKLGYIKDSDGDTELDYVEIVLKDTLSSDIDVRSVSLVVNGDTLKGASVPELNSMRDKISLDVSDFKLPEEFPNDAYAIITYVDHNDGTLYERTVDVVEVGSQVIKAAHAIRNKNGRDSLFIEFNIDLIPADIAYPEMLVMIKQEGARHGFDLDQITNVYMPTKNLIILVGDSLGLAGGNKDSISLYPNLTFNSLPYLTSDEYEREVPVTVEDRLPSVKNVEYWDADGDGVLDQIVTNFSEKLSSEDLSALYMSYPWYSDRGYLIQLQAQPDDFIFDSKDSTRVVWNVHYSGPIVKGVTSISEELPQATVYSYYSIFGETFVNEESAPLVDKMSPVISAAVLSYGNKADTLTISFSEVINCDNLKGNDFFSYIHGKDTIDLTPSEIIWSSDGMAATLIIDGHNATILPGDSLMVVKGSKDVIRDNFGNIVGENPQAVVISGLLNHLVETTKMGTFDDDNSVLQTLSSVNLRYVPGTTTKEDIEKEGSLGQLVQLGERFVPQLLDRAQISADGTMDPSVLDSLDPEKVFISFVVSYYDHLGQYVNDTTITVPCNSAKFGGNCLNTDQKVFVNWNFKDHKGRFVGTGVYMVQFKMVVKYEKKKIEEEIKDKWGVRRKKAR